MAGLILMTVDRVPLKTTCWLVMDKHLFGEFGLPIWCRLSRESWILNDKLSINMFSTRTQRFKNIFCIFMHDSSQLSNGDRLSGQKNICIYKNDITHSSLVHSFCDEWIRFLDSFLFVSLKNKKIDQETFDFALLIYLGMNMSSSVHAREMILWYYSRPLKI